MPEGSECLLRFYINKARFDAGDDNSSDSSDSSDSSESSNEKNDEFIKNQPNLECNCCEKILKFVGLFFRFSGISYDYAPYMVNPMINLEECASLEDMLYDGFQPVELMPGVELIKEVEDIYAVPCEEDQLLTKKVQKLNKLKSSF